MRRTMPNEGCGIFESQKSGELSEEDGKGNTEREKYEVGLLDSS